MRAKVVVASVLSLMASSALAQSAIGVVKLSRGEVVIERGGKQIAPAKGTEIHPGDRVITGNGVIHINMRRAAPVTVAPYAAVTLDRFAVRQETVVQKPTPSILKGLASYIAVNRQR